MGHKSSMVQAGSDFQAAANSRFGRKKKVVLGASASLAVVALATAAFATHYDFDNLVPTAIYAATCIDDTASADGPTCQTDNATLVWSSNSTLEAADLSAITDMMDNEYDETDLNVSYDSTPVLEGANETDIIYQESDSNVPAGLDGMTWCTDPVGTHSCDQQYVRIRPGFYVYSFICHETGHAVGLLHGDEAYDSDTSSSIDNQDSRLGCMVQAQTSNTTPLGDNQRKNINDTY